MRIRKHIAIILSVFALFSPFVGLFDATHSSIVMDESHHDLFIPASTNVHEIGENNSYIEVEKQILCALLCVDIFHPPKI